ncbi:unnamed protein product [Victoria cruziana]
MEMGGEAGAQYREVGDGSVDYKGMVPLRATTGAWKASLFIIVLEFGERLCYFGIVSNLIMYLITVLHQDVKTAAKNVNEFVGVSTVVPLIAGFFADSYTGSFWMVIFSTSLYQIGLILLTASQLMPSLKPPPCVGDSCDASLGPHKTVFFMALYLIAIASGVHKPSMESFGADQFDETDHGERMKKTSFFNWWFFGACSGTLLGVSAFVYITTNLGWGLGFAVLAICLAIVFVSLLVGTPYYRYKVCRGSPLTPILQVFVAAMVNKNRPLPSDPSQLYEPMVPAGRSVSHTSRMRFLDKAAIRDQVELQEGSMKNKDGQDVTTDLHHNPWRLATVTQVEETKQLLSMFPIWFSALMYGICISQSDTFFIKQGYVMDRHLTSSFEVPAGAILTISTITMVIFVSIYDRLVIPILRRFTGNERGITILQRIGVGLFLSITFLVASAIVEKKRKDSPIPISFLWLCPQLVLMAIAEIFTFVGLQEFFYGQVPDNMKTLGMGIYLSVFGVSSLLSSILISIVDFLTSRGGNSSWFGEDINKSKIDYFFWLLALMSIVNVCIYVWLARRYSYKPMKGRQAGLVVDLPDGNCEMCLD